MVLMDYDKAGKMGIPAEVFDGFGDSPNPMTIQATGSDQHHTGRACEGYESNIILALPAVRFPLCVYSNNWILHKDVELHF